MGIPGETVSESAPRRDDKRAGPDLAVAGKGIERGGGIPPEPPGGSCRPKRPLPPRLRPFSRRGRYQCVSGDWEPLYRSSPANRA